MVSPIDPDLRINALKATAEEQLQLRKLTLSSLQSGKTGRETAKLLGVSEAYVSKVKKAYKNDGIAGLVVRKRGRRHGDKRLLTPEQEEEIQYILVNNTPSDFNFPGCLWTRKLVRDLITQQYNTTLSLSSVGYYLKRWEFSVQRPVKKAYKQDEKKLNSGRKRNFKS
jgi:Transposase and inactivated derivatives